MLMQRMPEPGHFSDEVRRAVRRFWRVRHRQSRAQGGAGRYPQPGQRAAVVGGQHMSGFVDLIQSVVIAAGLPKDSVLAGRGKAVLPGWFRPSKEWDVCIVCRRLLLAAIQLKSQVSSFGNNFNNRAEEAIGSAVDLSCAWREGAFDGPHKPWLGYLVLLADCPASRRRVQLALSHFVAFPEFQCASYIDRYSVLCARLEQGDFYDATCLLVSEPGAGYREGAYCEPDARLAFSRFAASLIRGLRMRVQDLP